MCSSDLIAGFAELSASSRLRDEQTRARIGLKILGMHRHRADQEDRLAELIKRVRHDRRERVSRVLTRERGERSCAPQVRERPRALGVRRLGNCRSTCLTRRASMTAHGIFLSAAIASRPSGRSRVAGRDLRHPRHQGMPTVNSSTWTSFSCCGTGWP